MEDKELLEGLKNQATRSYSFHLLVKKYQKRVYWQIRRMVIDHDDADDVSQNVWIKVWNNIDSFKQDSQLFTWIYKIASNETLTFLAQKKRRAMLSLDDYNTELINNVEENHPIDGDKLQLKLQKAILTLPEKQRLVFQMRYYEELPYEEISQIVGTSVGALKASYHIAVKKIEQFILMPD